MFDRFLADRAQTRNLLVGAAGHDKRKYFALARREPERPPACVGISRTGERADHIHQTADECLVEPVPADQHTDDGLEEYFRGDVLQYDAADAQLNRLE